MNLESSLHHYGSRALDGYNLDFSMRKFFRSLPGRMLLALFITLVMAALLLLVFLYIPILPDTLYGWVSVAAIGLTAGLSARLLMGDSSYFLRILTALPALILGFIAFLVGLVLLSLLTQVGAGIDFTGGAPSEFGLKWLFPLLLGALFVLLSSWSWRLGVKPGKRTRVKSSGSSSKAKPRIKKSPAAKSKPKVKTKGSASKVSRTSSSTSSKKTKIKTTKKTSQTRRTSKPVSRTKKVKSRPAAPAVVRRGFWAAQIAGVRSATRDILKGGTKIGNRAPTGSSPRSNRKVQVRPKDPKTLARRKRIKGHNVNLSSVVEHRCPYCLEEVVVNDPRGVRICPVCGTRHHRDCWNVTGTCQVPHE